MSSGCGDVISLEDLQTAKKHQIFEAEVITGKTGGVSGGANIDFATNAVTGQVQKTLPAILRDAGFRPASFTFDTGGTLTTSDADLAVLWPGPDGDGQYYVWHGALPKVVPASSTPASAGGISDTAWVPFGDITMRKELASTTGTDLVGVVGGGTLTQRLGDYVSLDSFMVAAGGNADAAIDLATAYCAANNIKVIQLGSGKKYSISASHTIPNGITFRGDREDKSQQGSGTISTGTPAERAANPSDSAFLWYGGTGVTWFNCGSQVSFIGIVFGAPNQVWTATTKSQIVDYGTAISAAANLNVVSCVYYGMTNFVVASGPAHLFKDNFGFCMERDYQITGSRDLNRFETCHANPNVIRPSESMWRCLISNARTFITLTNHDGTMIRDCHTFCFKKAIVNKNANNYLGMLSISDCMFDQTGCFIDADSTGDGAIHAINVEVIGDNACDAGSTTADADSGYFILRKTVAGFLVTPIHFSGCSFQSSSAPVTAAPPYMINFQTSSGYAIHPTGSHCPQPSDNGAGSSCQIFGTTSASFRQWDANPTKENYIPNGGWAMRHPINASPRGWYFTDCTVTPEATKTVTSTASGTAVFGIRFRQQVTNRTYVITAVRVGSSSGVTVTATNDAGTSNDYSGTWVKKGQKYYCIITVTGSTHRLHDIKINAGDSGGTVQFDYAAMVSGTVLNHGGLYSERPPKQTETGCSNYSVSLSAGASSAVPVDMAGLAGAYRIQISSAIGAMNCRVIKLNNSSTPTITVEDSVYAGSNTFTVTWPTDSTPVIASSGAGNLFITISGTSYLATY